MHDSGAICRRSNRWSIGRRQAMPHPRLRGLRQNGSPRATGGRFPGERPYRVCDRRCGRGRSGGWLTLIRRAPPKRSLPLAPRGSAPCPWWLYYEGIHGTTWAFGNLTWRLSCPRRRNQSTLERRAWGRRKAPRHRLGSRKQQLDASESANYRSYSFVAPAKRLQL